jgi:hypothetical protein
LTKADVEIHKSVTRGEDMKRRTRDDSATHATSFPRVSATIPRVRAFVWGSVPFLTNMYSGHV